MKKAILLFTIILFMIGCKNSFEDLSAKHHILAITEYELTEIFEDSEHTITFKPENGFKFTDLPKGTYTFKLKGFNP